MDEAKVAILEDQRRLLQPDEVEEDVTALPYTATRPCVEMRLLHLLITAVIACAVGVYAGRMLQPSDSRYGLLYPVGTDQKQYQHNKTFTQRPDENSEAAWASIIPIGRGFVHHDKLAPFASNIAVFHQLHCLHAMVVAYYDALEAPSLMIGTEPPEWDDESLTRIAIPHIRHCFDYLRQSIMCASDTNLEVVDHITRTTSGWGQAKTCRNYNAIFAWAEKYANSSDTGIVT